MPVRSQRTNQASYGLVNHVCDEYEGQNITSSAPLEVPVDTNRSPVSLLPRTSAIHSRESKLNNREGMTRE